MLSLGAPWGPHIMCWETMILLCKLLSFYHLWYLFDQRLPPIKVPCFVYLQNIMTWIDLIFSRYRGSIGYNFRMSLFFPSTYIVRREFSCMFSVTWGLFKWGKWSYCKADGYLPCCVVEQCFSGTVFYASWKNKVQWTSHYLNLVCR